MDAVKIAQDYMKATKEALEMAETEMRYADWGNLDPENVGRQAAYIAVCKALQIAGYGIEPK